MRRALLTTLLTTTVIGAPLAATDLSGSRPGTFLPQVIGEYAPTPEFRPVLDGLRLWVSNHCAENGEVMEVYDRLINAMCRDGAFDDHRHLQTVDALFYAAEAHQYQVRKAPPFNPYIIHPMGVALILWEEGGVRDPDVLAAALLHDTVEDTNVTLEAIGERFGAQVASYVSEVTDDKSLPKEDRKQLQIAHAAEISHGARQLKMADKIYNLRNLKTRTPVEFEGDEMTPWPQERVEEYFAWATKVSDGLRGVNEALEHELADILSQA